MNDFIKQYTHGLDLNKKQQAIHVDYVTRFNSSYSNYFYNIPVEGQIVMKKVSSIFFTEGDTQFASRIVEKGNILSFVNLDISVDKSNFWNESIYRQLILSSFWTFNNFFLQKLINNISGLLYDDAITYYKLLDSNFYPYRTIPILRGNEYEWARTRKLPACLRDEKLTGIFKYDYQNRFNIRMELKKHCIILLRVKRNILEIDTSVNNKIQIFSTTSLDGKVKIPKEKIQEKGKTKKKSILNAPTIISFSDMIDSKSYSSENRLEYIKNTMELARAKHNIFIPPILKSNNKKLKGFNGTVAAMVSFFHKNEFFYKIYTEEDIIEAFINDYKFTIPKYKGNFSFFTDQNDFKDLIKRLKRLNIT